MSTDRAQRRAVQSETLEALFEIFFRVLKQATASGLLASGRSGESVPCAFKCRACKTLCSALGMNSDFGV